MADIFDALPDAKPRGEGEVSRSAERVDLPSRRAATDMFSELPDVKAPTKKQVGFIDSAARTFGGAGVPAATTIQLGLGNAFAKAADAINNLRTGRNDSFYQDALLGAVRDKTQEAEAYWAPAEDEELNLAGKFVGGMASMGTNIANVATTGSGNMAARKVLDRGGSAGEAAIHGLVSQGVDTALAVLPAGAAAKTFTKSAGNAVKNYAVGAVTGAGVGLATDIAGRAAKDASLPDRPEFKDMKQPEWNDPEAAAFALGGGALGGAIGARSKRSAALKKAAELKAAEFPEAQFTKAEDGTFMAPNGAHGITPERWADASPQMRDDWMEKAAPPPAPEAMPAPEVTHLDNVHPDTLAAVQEHARVTAANSSPEVKKIADAVLATEQRKAVARHEATALRKAAEEVAPESPYHKALLARADKLDPPAKPLPEGKVTEGWPTMPGDTEVPTKPLPVGKATEGQPDLKSEVPTKPLPVGKVIEGMPELPSEAPTKPLPVGKVTEGWPGEHEAPTKPLPVGEVTEVTGAGVTPVHTDLPLPVGEAKELYTDPARPQVKGEEPHFDLAFPKIDEGFMHEQERNAAKASPPAAPAVLDRGRRHVVAELDRGAADGTYNPDAVSLAKWTLGKNPNLARDVRLQGSDTPPVPGAKASYSHAAKLIEVFKGKDNPRTIVHEILHHSERMLPEPVRDGIRRAWRRELDAVAKKADPELRKALEDIPRMMAGDAEAKARVTEAFKAGVLKANEHYHLYNPSEFWAVNAPRILHERFEGRGSWRAQAKQWMREMVEHVKSTIGMRSDAPVLTALRAALDPKKTTGEFKHETMLSKVDKDGKFLDLGEAEKPPVTKGKGEKLLPDETKVDTKQRQFFDSLARIVTAQDAAAITGDKADMRLAAKLMIGKVQHRTKVFEREMVRPLGDMLKEGKKLKVTVKDLDDYVTAHHALERNPEIAKINKKMPDGGSGVTNAQAQKMLDRYTPEQTVHLEKMAQHVYKMNNAKLDAMVTDGLVTPEARDAMRAKYKKYVPFKTLDEEADFTGLGRGYQMWDNDIAAALGRTTRSGSPVAASLMDATHAIARGERARVNRAVWEYANDLHGSQYVAPFQKLTRKGDVWLDESGKVTHPPPALLKNEKDSSGNVTQVIDQKAVKEHTVNLLVNGKVERIFVADPLLKETLASAGSPEQVHQVLRAVGNYTRILSRMMTEWNPSFAPVNVVRDSVTAMIRAKRLGLSARDLAPDKIAAAWKDVFAAKSGADTEGARAFKEMQEAGGQTGSYGLTNVHDTMAHLEKLGAELGYDDQKGGGARRLKNAVGVLGEGLSHYNEVFEYAPRLAAYRAARAKGMSPERAAAVARDVTIDFNVSGTVGRTLGNLFSFFNASLQGLAGDVKDLKSPATRYRMISLAALGAAAELYNHMASGMNDETGEKNIDAQHESVKDNNLTLAIPDTKNVVKVPLPPGIGTGLYTLGRRAAQLMLDPSKGSEKYEKAAVGMAAASLNSIVPIRLAEGAGAGSNVIHSAIPTLIGPVGDLTFNKSHFGGDITPEDHNKKAPMPAYMLSRRTTSDVAKQASKFINYATGGDDIKPGRAQEYMGANFVSPEAIEHLVSSYTGGVGQTAMQTSNVIRNAKEGKPQDYNKMPVVRRFFGTEPQSYTGRRYRELQAQYEYAENYDKTGKPEKVPAEIRESMTQYQEADKTLGKLFKELRTAPESRREDLQAEIKTQQSRVIKAYNAAKAAHQ